jgi:protein phosphatase
MADKTSAHALKVTASGATEMGRGRVHNDDMVLLRPDLELFAVADGAGASGNVASAVATASIANYYEATERIQNGRLDVDGFGFFTGSRRIGCAVHKANRDIAELAAGWKQYRRMGATVVALAFSADTGMAHVANVGDSRCYRLRRGELEQLTEDHSLMADAIALRPDIDDEELARLPANVVTRTLGTKDGLRVNARSLPVVDGDRYILCSDGLTDVVGDDALRKLMSSHKATPEDLARRLIRAANEASGDDNVAVIVVSCEIPQGASLTPLRRAPKVERLRPPAPSQGEVVYELTSEDEIEVDDDPTADKRMSAASASPHHGKTLPLHGDASSTRPRRR